MLASLHSRWQAPRRARGFTLVEILIVVSLIALLATFAIPSYQRVRKRTQAVAVKTDLKALDDALTQYAFEYNKAAGVTVTFETLKPYLKTSSPLYMTGADLFGNVYGPTFTINAPLYPPPATYQALSDVADDAFWAPFIIPPP